MILLFSLVLSFNVFGEVAREAINFKSLITFSPADIPSENAVPADGKQAAVVVINDAQSFYKTLKMTAFLDEKVKSLQAKNSRISDLDAIDVLVGASVQILNN